MKIAGPMIRLLAALMVSSAALAQTHAKGHLLIIGGGDRGEQIMETFVRLAGGEKAKVVIFPMASGYANEVGPETVEEFKQLGISNAQALNIDRAQANTDSVLSLMEGVTGVFFSGGDQSRLTAVLKGTKVEALLHQLYHGGAVIAGTSAGAAVMSEVMITGDQRRPVGDSTFNKIEADNIVTTDGFGFIKNAIVDQHFVRRRRHNRLLSLVMEKPGLLGIGIDEATAAWIKPDQRLEVVGENAVIVYDATDAKIARDAPSQSLAAANLRLHVLRHGAVFDLRSKKVARMSQQ